MKRTFILFMVGFVALATVAYLAYLLFDSFHAMYKDWRLSKEMSELESWSRQKKKQTGDAAGDPTTTSRPPDA